MRNAFGLLVTAAIVATLTLGIAVVWLTKDPRAFGVVVMLAGMAASYVVAKDERQGSGRHAGRDMTAPPPAATTDLTKPRDDWTVVT